MSRAQVEDIDTGWNAFMRNMESITREQGGVKVGVFDPGADPSGVSNIQLAAIHEFGAPRAGIPQRSFLRSTVDANRDKYVELEKDLVDRALRGKISIEQAMGILGAKAVADVKATIRNQTGFAPLADSTLAERRRAGFAGTKALIRTGQLLNSITWAYEEKAS